MKFQYPKVRRDDTVSDTFHGRKVNDPYRWLEDMDSKETKQFVTEQNKLTRDYIEKCTLKDKIQKKASEMYSYPKVSSPMKVANKYFFMQNSGLQAHSVLYGQDTLDSEPRVILDPNTWSADGGKALSAAGDIPAFQFSSDGKYLAYFVTEGGSDWATVKFLNVETLQEYPDALVNCKFVSAAWARDNSGVFYTRFDNVSRTDAGATANNLNQKVYFHRLGDKQDRDVLIAEFPEMPECMLLVRMTDCGNYLVLLLVVPTHTKLCVIDLTSQPSQIKGKLQTTDLLPYFDNKTMNEYVTNVGTTFVIKTNENASNTKLISVDLKNNTKENVKTLVAESEDSVLNWAKAGAKDKLILCYSKDVKDTLIVHDLATGKKLSQLDLDIGTIQSVSSNMKDDLIFINYLSFLRPGAIYTCNLSDGKYEVKMFKESKIPGFNADDFAVKQVFYNSKDGTRVPMTILHKKGIALDSSHPCFMYGYGGFAISLTPTFVNMALGSGPFVFLKHFGGVLAYPNLRGGAEYGENWHQAGVGVKKQNVFDDFIAAAKYLQDNGYTTSKRLTICGSSNGGILVGACTNQAPERFGCTILQIGVTDLIRFPENTIGKMIVGELGDPAVKEQFDALIKVSPLHNIRVPQGDVQYPAVLVQTGDHDDRCPPGMHSYKYTSEIQHTVGNQAKQTNPLMLSVEKDAGHLVGKSTEKRIAEITDIYSFMAQTTNLQWRD